LLNLKSQAYFVIHKKCSFVSPPNWSEILVPMLQVVVLITSSQSALKTVVYTPLPLLSITITIVKISIYSPKRKIIKWGFDDYSLAINKVFLSPLGCLYWQLGFLCLFIFMPKENLAKRKFNSFLARFEHTTTQLHSPCTSIQPIHVSW